MLKDGVYLVYSKIKQLNLEGSGLVHVDKYGTWISDFTSLKTDSFTRAMKNSFFNVVYIGEF